MGETNRDQKSSLNNGSDEELGKGLIDSDQPDSEFSGIEITYSMKVSLNNETINNFEYFFFFRLIDFCIG